jgi:non-ribosomal peptide synthetase component E (peptide arylation enzyme)
LSTSEKIDADAVRDHPLVQVESNCISKYTVPEIDRIAFVSEIPKTSVGKINKKVLRERKARHTPGRPCAGRPPSPRPRR